MHLPTKVFQMALSVIPMEMSIAGVEMESMFGQLVVFYWGRFLLKEGQQTFVSGGAASCSS